jgi:hypothetical protein
MDSNMTKVGDRIKLLSPMTNHNSTWKPVEDGMPVGLEGTVTYVNFNGPREFHQISVRWDNGRSLSILPYHDQFRIIPGEVVSA